MGDRCAVRSSETAVRSQTTAEGTDHAGEGARRPRACGPDAGRRSRFEGGVAREHVRDERRRASCHRGVGIRRHAGGTVTAPLTPLPPDAYRDLVRRALMEDVGPGDITTNATVTPEQTARGVFLVKSACVVA